MIRDTDQRQGENRGWRRSSGGRRARGAGLGWAMGPRARWSVGNFPHA